MKEFIKYIDNVEENLEEKDKEYFNNITKPLFIELFKQMNIRLEEIENRFMATKKNKSVQSQIIIGNIAINDVAKINNMSPIIPINNHLKNVFDNKKICFKSGFYITMSQKQKVLFSIVYNKPYQEFTEYAKQKIPAKIILSSKEEIYTELSFKINDMYINAEKNIKEMITKNRIEDKYFDIPICRRILDVYINTNELQISNKIEINEIQLQNAIGDIVIPMWNIKKCVDNKIIGDVRCSPYGKNKNRNVYIGIIELKEDFLTNCLVEFNGFCNKKFLYTLFQQNEVCIYSFDKKCFEEEFILYNINECNKELDYASYITHFDILNDIYFQNFIGKRLSQAMLINLINNLFPITGYELEKINIKGNDIFMDIKKTGEEIGKNSYDNEMKQFLINALKMQCSNYNFYLE